MKLKEIYSEYLSKLETALNEENYDNIDYILAFLNIPNIEEDVYNEISDIIDEATLYSELRDTEYRDQALELISEYK